MHLHYSLAMRASTTRRTLFLLRACPQTRTVANIALVATWEARMAVAHLSSSKELRTEDLTMEHKQRQRAELVGHSAMQPCVSDHTNPALASVLACL